MTLDIQTFVLGPLENNTYLVSESQSRQAVVIDPSFEVQPVIEWIKSRGLLLQGIWLTHAHFDHTAGVQPLRDAFGESLPVALHPDDLPLWQQEGGARYFGMRVNLGADPTDFFSHGEKRSLGDATIEIRHTPGHSGGHVVFYLPTVSTVICGDLIFQGSVGRTDLPGSSMEALMHSIEEQILTLPPETVLLSGHGSPTTVGDEARSNPFLS